MSFRYTPGLGHAGCYIVSGYPVVTTGTMGSTDQEVEYDWVTKEILVMNHGPSDLFVFFAYDAVDAYKFKIEAGKQYTFDVKTKRVYFSGNSGVTYSVCASLTTIPAQRIEDHSGKGVNEAPEIVS